MGLLVVQVACGKDLPQHAFNSLPGFQSKFFAWGLGTNLMAGSGGFLCITIPWLVLFWIDAWFMVFGLLIWLSKIPPYSLSLYLGSCCSLLDEARNLQPWDAAWRGVSSELLTDLILLFGPFFCKVNSFKFHNSLNINILFYKWKGLSWMLL